MPDTQLQEGIYYNYKETGKSIGRFLTIMLLKVKPCATAYQVGQTLQKLWDIYQDLKNNKIRDFEQPIPNLDEKEPCQCPADLTVLVGYGPKCFNTRGVQKSWPGAPETFSPPTTNSSLTSESEYQSILSGSGLVYAKDVDTNPADTEIVFQFIGNTQLTVYRPVVETWKYLHDIEHDQSIDYCPPLEIETFYSGFRREDRRSWIDFHDGVSDLTPATRLKAIEHTAPLDEFPRDGSTYLAFLRIEMDLAAWRSLLQFDATAHPSNWEKQELAVGRSHLTGCALVDDTQNGLRPLHSCLPASAEHIFSDGAERGIVRMGSSSPLSHSHVQRANHQQKTERKIFRQGFEFLEPAPEPPGFRAGLNFISFQKHPNHLTGLLTEDGWLRKHNFGGDPTDSEFDALKHFLTVRAAGIYLVPPRADAENKTLPGLADLFPAQETERVT